MFPFLDKNGCIFKFVFWLQGQNHKELSLVWPIFYSYLLAVFLILSFFFLIYLRKGGLWSTFILDRVILSCIGWCGISNGQMCRKASAMWVPLKKNRALFSEDPENKVNFMMSLLQYIIYILSLVDSWPCSPDQG